MAAPFITKAVLDKAAKSGGEALRTHINNRQAEDAAITDAIRNNPDAAVQVATLRHRQTRIKALALLATAGIMSGGLAYVAVEGPKSIAKGLDKLWHDLESGTPKPELSMRINSELDHIKLPTQNINLVQGDGTSSARVVTQEKSSTPVVGGLYNALISPGTGRSVAVEREDSIQVTMPGSAVTLQAYAVDGPASGAAQTTTAKAVWGVEAIVPADAFGVQLVNPRDAVNQHGMPELQANTSWFNSAMQTFGEHDRSARYVSSITQMADYNFVDRCETFLQPAIPAGIQNYVSALLSTTIQLERSLGQTDNANLLQSVASQPIKVVFEQTNDLSPKRQQAVDVPASAIVLPQMYVPDTAAVAKILGLSTNEVSIDNSAPQCTASPTAVQDLLGLTSQA